MSKFLREYELIVGNNEEALKITDLRVSFEITKDLFGVPNLARINIYNLSKDTRAQIEDEFEAIVFNIGYKGNVQNVFIGEIRNVSHARQGVDFITTLFCGDGDKTYRNGFVSFSLENAATTEQILDTILEQTPELVKGFVGGLDETAKREDGIAMSGNFSEVMDKLAAETKSDWSIQDGKIQLLGYDAENDRPIIVISSSTGMISSPTITELGVEVQSLIEPQVVPGQIIEIKSEATNLQFGNLFFSNPPRTDAEGFYKVVKTTMKGDTRANDWSQTTIGRPLPQ